MSFGMEGEGQESFIRRLAAADERRRGSRNHCYSWNMVCLIPPCFLDAIKL